MHGVLKLGRADGTEVIFPIEIEEEVLQFYKKLVGCKTATQHGLDLIALRSGKQLSTEQRGATDCSYYGQRDG